MRQSDLRVMHNIIQTKEIVQVIEDLWRNQGFALKDNKTEKTVIF